jgi:hypothetical protein
MSRVVLVLGLDSSRRIDRLGCVVLCWTVLCAILYHAIRGKGKGAGWLTLYGVGSLEKRISAFVGQSGRDVSFACGLCVVYVCIYKYTYTHMQKRDPTYLDKSCKSITHAHLYQHNTTYKRLFLLQQ